MNSKEFKILAHLDKNARITTKELGKKLNISQQSANYLLHKIERESYFLNYKTVIDSAKFGLTKVIVLYDFTKFNMKRTVIAHLKKIDMVSIVEECSQGNDLMVEFTTHNLSSFNKENKNILHTFNDSLKQASIYPVIVKHNYGRKYLGRLIQEEDLITSGDRDLARNTSRETTFLQNIFLNSRIPMVEIARQIKCDTKTAIIVKKKLEKKSIIKKYSVSINTPSMGISRIHVLLNIDMSDISTIDSLLEFLKKDPHVISAQKIIGDYELFITIEQKQQNNKTLNTIRENFTISNYKLIFSENILKEVDTPDIYFTELE